MQKNREPVRQSREKPKREEKRQEQARSQQSRALAVALSRSTALEGKQIALGALDGKAAALLGNARLGELLDAQRESLPREAPQGVEPADVPALDVPDEELPTEGG